MTPEELIQKMKDALAASPLVVANTERMDTDVGTPVTPSTPTNTMPTPVVTPPEDP